MVVLLVKKLYFSLFYKKIVPVFGLLAVLFFVAAAWFRMPVRAEQAVPSVSAKAAALINADTGELLFAKKESEPLSMASTTKIMTALLALEHAAVSNPEITLTQEMVTVEGSSMGLKAGYRLTLRDLAIGMLTVSGNDAANSAAIAMAGSKEEFAVLMNERAAQIGMVHTNFVTPSGLDDPEHYSTAYDMALLGAEAIRNEDFLAICSQKQCSVQFLEPDQRVRYTNHNRLLSMYDGCIGIKTGFTKKSGRCLVSAAERNGVRLVAVTLSAPDDWNDHQRMFDYGFSCVKSYPIDETNFSSLVPVVGGETDQVTVEAQEATESLALSEAQHQKLARVVELPRFLYAPVKAGQVVGRVRYDLDGTTVASVPLAVRDPVSAVPYEPSLWQTVTAWFRGLFS